MDKRKIISYIKEIRRPVFTTSELAALSGKSLSGVIQALEYLKRQGVVFKIYRGIWADVGNERVSPYTVIPFLASSHRLYVSFISALHLYGMIEQIPQVITLASTAHSRMVRTKVGVFAIHRIVPEFFKGFGWYKGDGNFLIAEPEKALVDSLYLSAFKKRQFGYFPELKFSASFSFNKAKRWVREIPFTKARLHVQAKLDKIVKAYS